LRAAGLSVERCKLGDAEQQRAEIGKEKMGNGEATAQSRSNGEGKGRGNGAADWDSIGGNWYVRGGARMAIALRILVVVVIVVAAILGFAATRPPRLRITRSVEIAAPPARVFGLVDDFHEWREWAPGDKDDPTSNRTYSGAAAGVGAVSSWRGNGNTSVARMEITEAAPDSRVVVTVDFTAPFVARNVNTFTLEAGAGGRTRVTWDFDGQNVYMMKVMGIFTDMDRMMGKHFEAGLENLKTAAEK
jgi:uncharacterized protein YndB with AHSA1/START domain